MNQILMTWNPGLANEDTWDPISSKSLSSCPSWRATSRLSAPSPEDNDEDIELAGGWAAPTANSSWPEYFQEPSSSMRTTNRQTWGSSDGHSTHSTVGAAFDNG
jgi:hypothetical protein